MTGPLRGGGRGHVAILPPSAWARPTSGLRSGRATPPIGRPRSLAHPGFYRPRRAGEVASPRLASPCPPQGFGSRFGDEPRARIPFQTWNEGGDITATRSAAPPPPPSRWPPAPKATKPRPQEVAPPGKVQAMVGRKRCRNSRLSHRMRPVGATMTSSRRYVAPPRGHEERPRQPSSYSLGKDDDVARGSQ